jgi:hypothetical protein
MPRAGEKWATGAVARNPVPGDVEGALRELGIEVDRVEGAEIWARCPQHQARTGKIDRHPSFSVNAERGMFCCLSCGYQGSFTQLVRDALAVSGAEAEAWVSQHGTLAYAARVLHRRAGTAPATAAPAWAGEPELAGFTIPPAWALAERDLTADAVARYGIVWDAVGDGWVLPIREHTGTLLGYQAKYGHLVRNRPRGVRKGLTLFGGHLLRGGTAVLVESPLDCARLWTAGVDGAVASFGATVSDQQIDLLVRLADQVLLALDNDSAGRQGAASVEKRLRGRMPPVKFFAYHGTAKDPGEMSESAIHRGLAGAATLLTHLLARR